MSDQTKKVMEDKKPVQLTEQQKANLFIQEYQALCEKHGYRIVVNPVWTSTNHGSFELVLQSSVGKLPEKQ